MYATTDELLVEIRRAIRKYPTELGRLKEIASLARRNLAEGIAVFTDWQSTITGGGKAALPQPVVDGAAKIGEPQPAAPESARTRDDAPDDALRKATAQSASGGITAQSTLSSERTRLQAQIAGCLEMETDPALQLFLKQLASDAHKYPVEFVRQELDAYLQAANPDDFLNRLAALHWQWSLDDVAADSDGRLLTRGNTGERKTVLARIRSNFEQETQSILRCYLAKLARQAVTDPVRAADGMESYLDGRTNPTWVWLAAVFVCGSPETAFQWRLQAVRRKVTDARLSGYLDKLEQAARRNLPAAAEKLEAVAEIAALLDGQAAVA